MKTRQLFYASHMTPSPAQLARYGLFEKWSTKLVVNNACCDHSACCQELRSFSDLAFLFVTLVCKFLSSADDWQHTISCCTQIFHTSLATLTCLVEFCANSEGWNSRNTAMPWPKQCSLFWYLHTWYTLISPWEVKQKWLTCYQSAPHTVRHVESTSFPLFFLSVEPQCTLLALLRLNVILAILPPPHHPTCPHDIHLGMSLFF